jgi:hypothetical protein
LISHDESHGDDHGHDHDHGGNGEIHIRFTPLEHNEHGPITAYRIVVLNETEPVPFVR